MKCPSCGADSNGRFCPECGAPLADAACTRCSAPLLPGARFCTQCGAAARSAIGGNTGWYVAAGLLVVMIAVVGILATRDPSAAGGAPIGASAAGGEVAPFAGGPAVAGSPPPLTGTPREQADRLFDRIMRERSAGNLEAAQRFLPMGIDAYRLAGVSDADGLYHLALLQASAEQHADAIATAERILKTQPDHLLALGAAGEAAEQLGDSTSARRYYGRFVEAYPMEKTKTTAEYLDHAKVLVPYDEAARRFLK